MIKVNATTIELRGDIIQLLCEASMMCKSLHKAASDMFDPVTADHLIAGLFELARMDDSEIEKCDPWEAALKLAKKIIDEN